MALVQEQLHVGREQQATGTLRVRVVPEAQVHTLALEQWREQVDIERVPVGREVDAAVPPWQDGDVWVVPVYEEVVVVQRRLVLKEELRLQPRREREVLEQEVALRRDHVVVERQAADGSWAATPASPPTPDHPANPGSEPAPDQRLPGPG